MNILRGAAHAILENLNDALKISTTFPLRHLAELFGKEFSVAVRGGATFHLRPHSSDASTIRQVFRNKEYDLSHFPQWSNIQQMYELIVSDSKTPIIVDAGANIGAAAVWFAKRFPKAIVFAVEPDPENAAQCRRNTQGIAAIKVIERAIGATDGCVLLDNPTNEAWAVQSNRVVGATHGIPICTIPSILADVPNGQLFITKIDIEGFELDLFSENFDWACEATVIYIEPHDWMPTTRNSSATFQRALGPLGKEMLISGENLVYVKRQDGNGTIPATVPL